MVYLSDKATDRDNNFNLIRAVAATLVLVSHATQIVMGKGVPEPGVLTFGHSLGSLAVIAFFAISGFLISMSFERTTSHASFIAARCLRIFPGLFVSLLFVAVILGPIATTLPLRDYFTHAQMLSFVPRNVALFSQEYGLPGVFGSNPQPDVESSIWTLAHEFLCYVAVFVAGMIGLYRSRIWMGAALAGYLIAWFAYDIWSPDVREAVNAFRFLTFPFAVGVAFYVWRDRLPLSLPLFAGLAAATWLLRSTVIYDNFLVITLSYGVFWLAYIPGGAIRTYNRLGDYSYGIYIYAFPIQGLVYWYFGPHSALENMLLAFPPTLLIAVLSWHVVERPAILSKARLLAWWQRPAAHRPALRRG